MATTSAVLKDIAQLYPQMSSSHQRIADVILKDPDSAAFYNVAELARAADVSDATVIRFSKAIGYSGFPELCQQLQSVVRMRLTTKERLERTASASPAHPEDAFFRSFEDDMNNLQMMMNHLDPAILAQCTTMLTNARRIGIVCARSTVSLGVFFKFYLNLLRKDSIVVTGEPLTLDVMGHFDSTDVVVGIGFSRYSTFTVRSLQYFKKNKVPVIAVTDYPSSPLASHADTVLLCPTGIMSHMDSLTAPLSLIQSILRGMSSQLYTNSVEELAKLEEIWDMFGVYVRDETD